MLGNSQGNSERADISNVGQTLLGILESFSSLRRALKDAGCPEADAIVDDLERAYDRVRARIDDGLEKASADRRSAQADLVRRDDCRRIDRA